MLNDAQGVGEPDPITPDIVIKAYASGIFPMAEDRGDGELFWLDPDQRGIVPLDRFHIPGSLAKRIRQQPFVVRVDSAFDEVVKGCAQSRSGRETTWISHRIQDIFTRLHRRGHAHSVECWQGDDLVGGLYGLALKGAFFGESMFHTKRDASKVALVYLVARLRAGGFTLLDTQFVTPHLARFGALEIPRGEYQARLRDAMMREADFTRLDRQPDADDPSAILHLSTHTS
ncbi:leucyl/phenylalanyl-tRNA--protein transferase [Yunchengibacter salinarum]|uniref:leucyl/phenylalanyl-tRNA--protein transferase n=1 Tax=Yunchengibacter salinarum TaxID=3133399 RepID=UPI0035B5C067